jgi:transposase
MKMRDIVHRRCCGLDVHKDQIAACVRWAEDNGEIEQETRVFGTTTEQLRSMGDWMRGHGVQLVAMESTGVYWRPVWNVLEGDFELKLANSQHIRNIPGKKTDKKDGAWIAKLLQHDLVPASFVPDTRIQELRELTRARARLVQEKTAVANRIQDVLENANIKLASVASDILGRSGRAMLEAIMGGESDPTRLADLAKAQLRGKIQRLRLALEGRIREHHRFSLRQLMDHLEFLEGKIFIIEEELRRRSQPYEEAIQLWMTIPGVRWLIAVTLVAEIGVDMQQFPSAAQLASWVGVCPGNNESGGKRKSGKTRKGSVWLRRALCEAAWAASRTKNTYLAAQYRRLAAKRGQKRASLAVAHSILVIAYHLLKNKVPYHELGGDYFDRIRTAGLKRYYLKRLEQLGVSVIESPAVSGG